MALGKGTRGKQRRGERASAQLHAPSRDGTSRPWVTVASDPVFEP